MTTLLKKICLFTLCVMTAGTFADELQFDFENDNNQGWHVKSGDYSDPVSVTPEYAAAIHGDYCLSSLYNGGRKPSDDFKCVIESPVITLTAPIITFIQGGGNIPESYFAVYSVNGDQLEVSIGPDSLQDCPPVKWDLSKYVGTQIYFRLVDMANGVGGHTVIDKLCLEGRVDNEATESRRFTPSVLPSTDITSIGFTVNWTAVPGATSYRLTVSRSNDFLYPLADYNQLFIRDTTSQVVNIPVNSTLYYKVVAYKGNKISAESDFGSVSPKTVNLATRVGDYLFSAKKGVSLVPLESVSAVNWDRGVTPVVDTVYNIYSNEDDRNLYSPIPFGFIFSFAGADFSHFDPRTDIHIAFHNGEYVTPAIDYPGILDRGCHKNSLAVLSADQKTSCRVQLTGFAGDYVMTIEYYDICWRHNNECHNSRIQVKLYEKDFHVEYIYDLRSQTNEPEHITHIGLMDSKCEYLSVVPGNDPAVLSSSAFNVSTNVGLGEGSEKSDDVLFCFAPPVEISASKVDGVEFVQEGREVSWSVANESNIKEYHVINKFDSELLEILIPGSGEYKATLLDGVNVKLEILERTGLLKRLTL